jgi:uncharacterized damage-inducible protein DinB
VVTVECDEKSVVDKRRLGALSPAAQSEAERCRLFLRPLLEKHMIWHEGYHHGQIKLALKATGRPLTDQEAGRVTWDAWMRKKSAVG